MQMPFSKSVHRGVKRLNMDRLSYDFSLSRQYNMDVKNRFDALGALDGDDVGSSWQKLSGAIMDAGKSVIGHKREIKQPCMTSGTFKVLQLKADARNQGLIQER